MLRGILSTVALLSSIHSAHATTVFQCEGDLDTDYKFSLIDQETRYVGELLVGGEKVDLEVCWAGRALISTPGNISACNNMDFSDRWNVYFKEAVTRAGSGPISLEIEHNEQALGSIQCSAVEEEAKTVSLFNADASKVIDALPELTKMNLSTGYQVQATDLSCQYTRGFIWANCSMSDVLGGGTETNLLAAGADELIRALVEAGVPITEHEEGSIVTSSLTAKEVTCSEGGFIGIPMCTIRY